MVIEKGEIVNGHVSVTSGNLTIRGEVHGDAIVVFGNADIEGKVTGNVYVFGGDVTLRAASVISGEVDYSGGTINREAGATVGGPVNKGTMPFQGLENSIANPISGGSPGTTDIWRRPLESIGALLMWSLVSIVTLGLAVALVVLAPRRVRVASSTLELEGGPSLIVGLIAAGILAPVVAGLVLALMITVVGWVLIPLVVALAVVALACGLAIIGVWLGRRVYQGTHHEPHQRPVPLLVQMLLGMAALLCSTVVPAAILPVGWIAMTLLALLYVAGCIGIGAIVLSRLGTLSPATKQRPSPTPQQT